MFGALASTPTWAAQSEVPEGGTKTQPVIALDGSQLTTIRARTPGFKILHQLVTDQLLWQAAKQVAKAKAAADALLLTNRDRSE